MTNPKELRQRIRNLASIERTVDAMQKISAARLARERLALLAARPYTSAIVEAVSELAAGGFSHPLLDDREEKGYMLVVIGSDRGLCGSYNSNLMRAVTDFVSTRRREKLFLITAGRKLRRLRPRTRELIIRESIPYPRPLSRAHVADVARTITEAYLHEDVARVYVVYTEFRGVAGNRPAVRRILPLLPPPAAPQEQLFEPAPGELLDTLMPQYVRAAIRAAFLEASVCEHAARMVSMEQASISTRKMIADLRLTANKLRQMTITRELLDIIGTAEALA